MKPNLVQFAPNALLTAATTLAWRVSLPTAAIQAATNEITHRHHESCEDCAEGIAEVCACAVRAREAFAQKQRAELLPALVMPGRVKHRRPAALASLKGGAK